MARIITIPGPCGPGHPSYEVGFKHGRDGRSMSNRSDATYVNGWADGNTLWRTERDACSGDHHGVACFTGTLDGTCPVFDAEVHPEPVTDESVDEMIETWQESRGYIEALRAVKESVVDTVDTGPHSTRGITLEEALGSDCAGDIANEAFLLAFSAGLVAARAVSHPEPDAEGDAGNRLRRALEAARAVR